MIQPEFPHYITTLDDPPTWEKLTNLVHTISRTHVTIGRHKAQVLIDSGATHNFIRPSLVHEFTWDQSEISVGVGTGGAFMKAYRPRITTITFIVTIYLTSLS